jgi:hypothetical protein
VKVVVNYLDENTMQATPTPPSSVHLIGADGLSSISKHQLSAVPAETPGGFLAIFSATDTMKLLMDSVDKGRIIVAFALTKGGIDIQVPIDLTVRDFSMDGKKTQDAQNLMPFLGCIDRLLKELR